MKLFFMGVILLTGFSGCAAHKSFVVTEKTDSVKLSLWLPAAGRVEFASSVDNYRPHEAHNFFGHWEITVPARVEFRYFYIVDGKVYVPDCRFKEKDDFGAMNCLYLPENR